METRLSCAHIACLLMGVVAGERVTAAQIFPVGMTAPAATQPGHDAQGPPDRNDLQARKKVIEARITVQLSEARKIDIQVGEEESLRIECGIRKLNFSKAALEKVASQLEQKRREIAEADRTPPTMAQLSATEGAGKLLSNQLDRCMKLSEEVAEIEARDGFDSPAARLAREELMRAEVSYSRFAQELQEKFYIRTEADGRLLLVPRDTSKLEETVKKYRETVAREVDAIKQKSAESATLLKLREEIAAEEAESEEINERLSAPVDGLRLRRAKVVP